MAKSKGLSTRYIMVRHALRPSSFSMLASAGLNIGTLITGAFVVEYLFGLNGIGAQLVNSINAARLPRGPGDGARRRPRLRVRELPRELPLHRPGPEDRPCLTQPAATRTLDSPRDPSARRRPHDGARGRARRGAREQAQQEARGLLLDLRRRGSAFMILLAIFASLLPLPGPDGSHRGAVSEPELQPPPRDRRPRSRPPFADHLRVTADAHHQLRLDRHRPRHRRVGRDARGLQREGLRHHRQRDRLRDHLVPAAARDPRDRRLLGTRLS